MQSGILCSVLLLVMVLCGGCDSKSDQQTILPKKPAKRLVIGMVPRAETPPWRALRKAAVKTATLLEVNLLWEAPARDNDAGAQLRAVDALIAQEVDAIAIAPVDVDTMSGSLMEASHKAPIVYFQAHDDNEAASVLIYSSGTHIGRIGAEQLVKAIGGNGNVAIIRNANPLASQYECEEAFHNAMLAQAKIEIVEGPICSDDPTAIAEATTKLLHSSTPPVGIFATTERATLAVLGALQASDWAGTVKLVGMGYDPKLLRGLEQGTVSALIVDDMPKIGDLAVKSAVTKARGQGMERLQLVEPLVLTRQNQGQFSSLFQGTP